MIKKKLTTHQQAIILKPRVRYYKRPINRYPTKVTSCRKSFHDTKRPYFLDLKSLLQWKRNPAYFCEIAYFTKRREDVICEIVYQFEDEFKAWIMENCRKPVHIGIFNGWNARLIFWDDVDAVLFSLTWT